MIGQIAGAACERMTQVREELTGIQHNIAELHKAIDDLRNKLRPVLMLRESPVDKCCKENSKEMVPLANELKGCNSSINDAMIEIRELYNNCEL